MEILEKPSGIALRGSTIWLFAVIFLIHDGEEAFTMAQWVNAHAGLMHSIAAKSPVAAWAVTHMPSNNGVAITAIAFELLIIVGSTVALSLFLSGRSKSRSTVYIFAALLSAYIIHVAAHIVQSVVLGIYTPGVITAVLVVPPLGGYLYWRLLRSGLLTARSAAITTMVGVLSIVPILWSAIQVGRLLFA